MGDTMNKLHCDVCDKVIKESDKSLIQVVPGVRAVVANIERYTADCWVPTDDHCRECLGNLMFEYSQWLLRKL